MENGDLLKYFEILAQGNRLPSLVLLHVDAAHLSEMYSSESLARATGICEFETLNIREAQESGGDWALANSITLMADGLLYLEFVQAVSQGDTGRVWEVLKMLLIKFAGSNNPKYMSYLIEMFCNIELEYPECTRKALFNNWLVNLEGKPGHFLEMDLMQEHFNCRLEELAKYKGKEFDDPWFRDVLSVNVAHFVKLTKELEAAVDLQARQVRHTARKRDADLNIVLRVCVTNNLHVRYPTRDLGTHAPNDFIDGMLTLTNNDKLGEKVSRSWEQWASLVVDDTFAEGYEDIAMYLRQPVRYNENGELIV